MSGLNLENFWNEIGSIDKRVFYHGYGDNKKDQHFGFANKFYKSESPEDFRTSRFVHQSMPEMKVDDVDFSTSIAGIAVEKPFFINAMTGGTEKTGRFNQSIGVLAHITKTPIASGSISDAIKDPSVASTFDILRRENPYGVIFANLGAHHSVENAKRAVDLLEANALQIHLNAPQELVMAEGDRDFSMWLTNIEKIVQEIDVPVIAKEVGFGMSRETITKLHEVGVQTVDVSGTGGTDFALIENARRVLRPDLDMNGWGQSTMISLLEAFSLPEEKRPQILASGGVKSAIDVVKCLAMGADAVGMSAHILRVIKERPLEEVIYEIRLLEGQVASMMTTLGAKTVADLRKTDLILGPNVQHWAEARGIDWKHYANRSGK